ncbi:MAG: TRAP transporter permease, partial [Bacillota bacterium]|nr:TRAP transporter permease [Bacillota bacterium]
MTDKFDKEEKKQGHLTAEQKKPVQKLELETDDDAELSSHRKLTGLLAKFIVILGVFTAIFHIYTLIWAPMDPWKFRSMHIMLLSVMGFILIPGWAKAKEKVHPIDWFFVAGSIFATYYIFSNFEQLLFRAGVMPLPTDFYVALLGTIMVLELARRASGLALPILCMVFIAYAFLGPYLPGMLYHRGYKMERFFTYIYGLDGIF